MPRLLAAVIHARASRRFVVPAAHTSFVASATPAGSVAGATRSRRMAHAAEQTTVQPAAAIARGRMPTLSVPLTMVGGVAHAVAESFVVHAVAISLPANGTLKPTGRNRRVFMVIVACGWWRTWASTVSTLGRRLSASVGWHTLTILPT